MIIEEPIGTVRDPEFAQLKYDTVNLEWFDTHKRIGRVVSKHGMEIGIRLNQATTLRGLRHDDVLYVHDGQAIVVNIPPVTCLVVSVNKRNELIRLCYEVGNRHAPLYYDAKADEFLFPYDKPMEQLLNNLNFAVRCKQAQLHPEQRVGLAKAHDHSHE
jgi:urease accessory protein